jgi:hypothetical protein
MSAVALSRLIFDHMHRAPRGERESTRDPPLDRSGTNVDARVSMSIRGYAGHVVVGSRLAWACTWTALTVALCGCALAVDWDSLRRGRPEPGDGSSDAPVVVGPQDGSDAVPLDGADATLPDSTVPYDAGSCSPAAGCYQVPVGWGLAGLDLTNTGSCPASFEGTMVVADPVVGPGSCQYGPCTVQQQPACSGIVMSGLLACAITAGSVAAHVCEILTVNSPASLELTPKAQGGACTVPVAAAPIAASAQACTNPAASICDGGACQQAFLQPFKACIDQSGEQTCPSGTPFTELHVTAVSATSNCPAATCQITTACDGTVTAYTDSACTSGPTQVPANASCYAVVGSIGSIEYIPGTAPAACTTVPPPPATISLVGERTFCCVP